ncbi:MAG: TonB-dependent receptor [bacterium]|nr:TonB-dependent receptor [bacterium]
MRGLRTVWLTAFLLLCAVPALAQDGQIEGSVIRDDGAGVGGVTVVINELGKVEITGGSGAFAFRGVPAGSYTLSYSLGDNADSGEVEVGAGETATVEKTVDWDVSFADTITVFSASRRRERIAEAPAAVTVITEEQIERESTHGQLPKLLEFTPGAEVTQSGVYDFNFNSRGFNSSLNRRIKVLLDGRDPSVTFLSNQEWSSLTVPLDELASVELVRGPGAALYGADAYNGVINMTTKSPADSTGGSVRLTGGDLSTLRGDLSASGALGGNWYGRLNAGYLESDDYARTRLDLNGNGVLDVPAEAEYPGLNVERAPLAQDQNEGTWGNVRVDRDFGGSTLSLETGYSEFEAGGAVVTGIGRTQFSTSERTHFRFNFNTQHWNVLGYHNERENPVLSLGTGAPLFLDSDNDHIEVQGNVGFGGGKGRFIGGASYSEETFDSTLPAFGVQSLVFSKVEEDFQGVYGQLEYAFTDKVKGVVSARYDESSLWDSEFSPRAALVFSPNPNHNFRVSYSEAFQSPNYSEYFLNVIVAPPVTALAGFEFALCAPFGVQCGLAAVPVKALGNPDLTVEQVETIEVGYTGVLGRKAYLTVDYYDSTLENFLTDLISPFNPTLGFINPAFGPYAAPAGIPEPFRSILEAGVRGAVPTMTNDPLTGLALISGATYTNFGDVDTQGIELGLNVYLTDDLKLDVIYNWFDFDVKEQLAADPLLANAPENQYGFSLSYIADKYDVSGKYRHVDGFEWAAGVFRGPVPSYDLVDLTGSYRINDRVAVGINISNLFDKNHYQLFGGDLLERRALGHIQFSW